MKGYDSFESMDLRLVYRVLHGHLTEHLELMDSPFFEGLQSHLQRVAKGEGVDVGDHAQWDAWLGGEVIPCEERVAKRRTLTLVRDDDD